MVSTEASPRENGSSDGEHRSITTREWEFGWSAQKHHHERMGVRMVSTEASPRENGSSDGEHRSITTREKKAGFVKV
jgi:hypothetical protein